MGGRAVVEVTILIGEPAKLASLNGTGDGYGDGTGYGDGYGNGTGYGIGNGNGHGDGIGDGVFARRADDPLQALTTLTFTSVTNNQVQDTP
jgi:hypothetical protein